MDIKSFSFAIAISFIYLICQFVGSLFEVWSVELERKRLFNKFLKSILKGV